MVHRSSPGARTPPRRPSEALSSVPGSRGKLPEKRFIEVVRDAPLVSVDLVVRSPTNQVLLGRRRNNPAIATWFVPGGRIWKDETITDAFSRISATELGEARSLEEARFLGAFEHRHDSNFAGIPGFGTHYVVLAYEILFDGDLPILPRSQHSEYRWFWQDQLLASEDVHAFTKEFFRRPYPKGPSELLALYAVHQAAISSYTATLWAFPAALFALNILAWSVLRATPRLLIALAVLNFPFLQAFWKLARNQEAIVSAIQHTEVELRKLVGLALVPNFLPRYGWLTKPKSAAIFRYSLVAYAIAFLAFVIWMNF